MQMAQNGPGHFPRIPRSFFVICILPPATLIYGKLISNLMSLPSISISLHPLLLLQPLSGSSLAKTLTFGALVSLHVVIENIN